MDKVLIILLLISAVFATDVVLRSYDLAQQDLSLVDIHSEGLPDTDTSENSEDEIRIDTNHLEYSPTSIEKQLQADNYEGSVIELYIETPNPPPKCL